VESMLPLAMAAVEVFRRFKRGQRCHER
jgi:hypothetical protein